MRIRSLLLTDPIARLEHQAIEVRVRGRLGDLLSVNQPVGALSPFVDTAPWRYWDDPTMRQALEILEGDVERSAQAMRGRAGALGRGLDNLFRHSAAVETETSLFGAPAGSGLVRLSTVYLPEYLRLVEHVFGNLLQVFWATRRKGGVDGKFDMRAAVELLQRINQGRITSGYDDGVRNAIAHGEVRFTAMEVEFGEMHPVRLTSTEFLGLCDSLARTCNSLALAILLYWLRNPVASSRGAGPPLAVVTRIASGTVNRRGFSLLGTVVSDYPSVGRQLHALIRSEERGKISTLVSCARVASHLLVAGASGYQRLLCEVDHGRGPSSLVILRPEVLLSLLAEDAEIDRLGEAFDKTQLVWHDEGKWKTRLRMWKAIARSAVSRARDQYIEHLQSRGKALGRNRFRIRQLRDISFKRIPRVKVTATLLCPEDASNPALVREIMKEIVMQARRRRIPVGSWIGLPWRRRPVHILISLYRSDGTLRWLEGSGWPGGNLVCMGERIWGSHAPIHVKKPEVLFERIRLRFQMDVEVAKKALEQARALVEKIQKSGQDTDRE